MDNTLKSILFLLNPRLREDARFAWEVIKPQSKQSTRWGRKHAYTSKTKRLYQDTLHESFIDSMDSWYESPVELTLLFCFASKKQIGEFKSVRPDLTNLIKPMEDSLIDVVFKDDNIVSIIVAAKIRWYFDAVAMAIQEAKELH